jgi:hypothetical protein
MDKSHKFWCEKDHALFAKYLGKGMDREEARELVEDGIIERKLRQSKVRRRELPQAKVEAYDTWHAVLGGTHKITGSTYATVHPAVKL